ncbi:MAG: electron transfer flavoprotein subunit alpha/FixB family protein, partial [Beijerinckiaceae bacterium]|nr:electron transfer flavoprotein subunit alpha/FixB family protein [Beijerinckiaceae bacterium]
AAPPPSRRPRRDPRAERAARRVEAGKPRFDAALEVDRAMPPPSAGPATVNAPREKPAPIILAEPAFVVLVVPDMANGTLTAHDRELMGAARVLAGESAAVIVLAGDCPDLDVAGADRRVAAPLAPAEAYDPDAAATHVAATIAALSPRFVLFAESADGGDLARRVAVRTGEPLFTNAEAVSAKLLRRAARNHRVEQSSVPPRLISVALGAVAPYAGAPREARVVELELQAAAVRESPISNSHVVPADPATVPLALADFVAAAGNGITDFASFNALAAALAATPGASRVLCDSGVMPRDRQVGASGTVLAARCYLALGIAGAPQHLQGVAGCEHVIAVNTDLHAAMIERADLAIVQDAQLVMPALLAALARAADGETPA